MLLIEEDLKVGFGFFVVRVIGDFCDLEEGGQLHRIFAIHQIRDENIEHVLRQIWVPQERQDT